MECWPSWRAAKAQSGGRGRDGAFFLSRFLLASGIEGEPNSWGVRVHLPLHLVIDLYLTYTYIEIVKGGWDSKLSSFISEGYGITAEVMSLRP